jgi:hypothetical protein
MTQRWILAAALISAMPFPAKADDPIDEWNCTCAATRLGQLRTTISRDGADPSTPGAYLYELQVVSVQGPGSIVLPLMKMDSLRAQTEQGHLVYRGQSATATALLSIREIPGEVHAPGTLKLAELNPDPSDPTGGVFNADLTCTALRR